MKTDNASRPTASTIPESAGYVFSHNGRGFDPAGSVGRPSQAEVDRHNAALAAKELAAMKAAGRGVLYLTPDSLGNWFASQWTGHTRIPVSNLRKSFHNMAGRDGRTDCDFWLDGARWHGVNVGDNQVLRVRRCAR